MARLFFGFARRLLVSKRHRRVRHSVVFLYTNLLLAASLVFALEVVFIYLGIGDTVLPLTKPVREFLAGLVL